MDDGSDVAHATRARGSTRMGLALALAFVLALGASRLSFCVDDGYIFARVAKNVVRGHGWSFNPGQPVNAMTSVLWTLVLTLPARFDLLSPAAICVMYTLGVAALTIGVATALKAKGPSIAWCTAAACAACPTLWDSVGLETALEAALVVWTIVAHDARRPWTAGGLLGLAILARPDAALLGVLVCAHAYHRDHRVPWRTGALAGAVVLPWLLYAHETFGGVLPVTLHAKAVQTSLGWWGKQPPLVIAALLHDRWPIAAVTLTLLASISVPRAYARAPSAALLLIAYGVLHAAAYTTIRAPAGYVWYYVPFHLALVVASALAVPALWNRGQFPARLRRARACDAVGAAFGAAFAIVVVVGGGPYRQSPQYRALASLVHSRATEDDAVAATEIGYIGFFSDARVLDIHGLVHPEVTSRIAAGESTWWVERRPRFVVTHEPAWFGEPGAEESPPSCRDVFERDYRVVDRIATSEASSVLLWERR